jgi:hypothetical protein
VHIHINLSYYLFLLSDGICDSCCEMETKWKDKYIFCIIYVTLWNTCSKKLFPFTGDSTGLDLCSVHSNGTLLRYYSSVISYGYLGDVVRDSEKFRWMGPKRYEYSGNYGHILQKLSQHFVQNHIAYTFLFKFSLTVWFSWNVFNAKCSVHMKD